MHCYLITIFSNWVTVDELPRLYKPLPISLVIKPAHANLTYIKFNQPNLSFILIVPALRLKRPYYMVVVQ